MKLYTPQVQLIKQVNMDGPDEYWLHAVTFCDKTYYRAAGHSPVPETADEDGIYHIELKIAQDMELPEVFLLTPVVHTIYLGALPFDHHDLVQVSLSAAVRGDKKPAGKVTVSSSSAVETRERPIDEF